MKQKVILATVCSLLVLLFMYASSSKLFDIREFTNDMRNQPFPMWLSMVFVWLIPSLEILISVLIILDRTRLMGLYASAILMSLFTIYTALVLFNVFYKVPCSCGGVIKNLTWTQHLFFNLFFVLISFIGIRLEKKLRKKNVEDGKISLA